MADFDDLQARWDDSDRLNDQRLDAIAEEVVRNHGQLKSILDARDLSEIVTAAILMGVFSFFAWFFFDNFYIRLGSLIVVAACVEASAVLLWGRRGMNVSPERLSVRDFTLHQQKLVRRQIGLLRHVAWWYLLPFYVGLMVMVYGFGDRNIAIIFAVVVTALYGWIWWLNQKAVAEQLQPLDDAYTMTVESIDQPQEDFLDRSFQALQHPAQCKSGSTQWLVAALFLCLIALMLPLFSLIKDSRHSYDKLSPFAAVRWHDRRPEVEVGGQWYELVKIDDVAASDIVAFSRRRYLGLSRKRFEEDLVEVLTRMGHPPGGTSTLTVKQLTSGDRVVLENVQWTRENRNAIKRRNDRPSGAPPGK